MLIDLNKFSSKKIFDENFFLYFEEFDLCKRIKDKEEDVFVSKDLIIDHLGSKGSFATDKNLKLDALSVHIALPLLNEESGHVYIPLYILFLLQDSQVHR